ncbi:hypothetical protein HNQ72_005545 [Rhizobium wenxiniae]|uniref:Uncharacterized protein n=1 Tax=Rhizobium wenxiniae TaxID=1737357 RepID=A0A7W9YC53_9HYPH|nr:hypothetical protein [Rhizobium wenxiniae]MBB6165697.1 hypothetical protein [Rhizobium wenxiniae]
MAAFVEGAYLDQHVLRHGDENCQPLQRPWLTLAIDVASPMVAGFNLSLDARRRLPWLWQCDT